MKRAREDVRVVTYLEHVPHEVFRHVCSYLDFADLHALYSAVVVVTPFGETPTPAVPTLGGAPLFTDFQQLASDAATLCAQETVRVLQHVIFGDDRDLTMLRYDRADAHCRELTLLGNVRRVMTAPCFYTRMLVCTPLCTRCKERFGTTTYWGYTDDPQHLCPPCLHDFSHTADIADNDKIPMLHGGDGDDEYNGAGGWWWISPSHLKALCQVPSATRAEDFARDNGIRALSDIDSDPATRIPLMIAGVVYPYPKPRKDFYFYKDVLAHMKSANAKDF